MLKRKSGKSSSAASSSSSSSSGRQPLYSSKRGVWGGASTNQKAHKSRPGSNLKEKGKFSVGNSRRNHLAFPKSPSMTKSPLNLGPFRSNHTISHLGLPMSNQSGSLTCVSNQKNPHQSSQSPGTVWSSVRAFSAVGQKVQRIPNDDHHRFKGKLTLITGAGGAIGRGVALQIAKERGNLMLVDMNPKSLEETKAMCLKANPDSQIECFTADCSKEEAVKAYVDKTVEVFGRIDCFYNNHGIEGPSRPLHQYSIEDMNRIMTVNANSFMWGLKYVIEWMVDKQGFGSIVNCSSIAGIRAIYNQSPYVTSKHAVSGLTKAAAIEYADTLNINSIHPGAIRTEMIERGFQTAATKLGVPLEAVIKGFAAKNPGGRIGEPAEVGYAVAFLLSHQASLINGVQINLDSGQIWQFSPKDALSAKH